MREVEVNEENRPYYQTDVLGDKTSKEVNAECIDYRGLQLCKTFLQMECPTDRVCLTTSDIEELADFLYPRENFQSHFLCSDIFFANTIPITDCVIEWTLDNPINGLTTNLSFRFAMFPDYKEEIQKADTDEPVIVGMVDSQDVSLLSYEEYFCLAVQKGNDDVLCYYVDPIFAENRDTLYEGVIKTAANIWYLVECAILNPLTKDIFAHPQRKRIRSSANEKHSKGKSNKKAPIRYVQCHVIDADEIKQIKSENSRRGINRKTMVWRVAGHWRHYKNGKVIFIQPYWKGPERDKKKDIPPRDREIVTKIESA